MTEEEAQAREEADESDYGDNYEFYDETCKIDLSKVWDYKKDKT